MDSLAIRPGCRACRLHAGQVLGLIHHRCRHRPRKSTRVRAAASSAGASFCCTAWFHAFSSAKILPCSAASCECLVRSIQSPPATTEKWVTASTPRLFLSLAPSRGDDRRPIDCPPSTSVQNRCGLGRNANPASICQHPGIDRPPAPQVRLAVFHALDPVGSDHDGGLAEHCTFIDFDHELLHVREMSAFTRARYS